jgi:uncharacterized protein
MHWKIEKALLRPLIAQELEIDTFDSSGWIAITPFTMWGVRPFPPFVPPLPGLSSMHELNVRTYVHFRGVPGVWFFSLDTNNAAAVLAARRFFFLPYHKAEITLERKDQDINYALRRNDDPAANFQATWNIGEMLPYSHPGSCEFFLTERYCLYTAHNGKLYRARIHHQPWPLQKAGLTRFSATMIEALGLPTPTDEPLLHYAEEVKVDIWPLKSL